MRPAPRHLGQTSRQSRPQSSAPEPSPSTPTTLMMSPASSTATARRSSVTSGKQAPTRTAQPLKTAGPWGVSGRGAAGRPGLLAGDARRCSQNRRRLWQESAPPEADPTAHPFRAYCALRNQKLQKYEVGAHAVWKPSSPASWPTAALHPTISWEGPTRPIMGTERLPNDSPHLILFQHMLRQLLKHPRELLKLLHLKLRQQTKGPETCTNNLQH